MQTFPSFLIKYFIEHLNGPLKPNKNKKIHSGEHIKLLQK